MIALDTNLLVYAHRSAVAEHRSARQAIVRARTSSGGWGFSLPFVGEFWSVVTHPTAAAGPRLPRRRTETLLRRRTETLPSRRWSTRVMAPPTCAVLASAEVKTSRGRR